MITKRINTRMIVRLFLAITTCAVFTNLAAQFAGGRGTEEDPWQIATAVHLNNIRNYLGQENNDKYFIQTAHIDLGQPPWNEDNGWEPIGIDRDNSFQGNYDGGEYVIHNLTIDRGGGNRSLFGYVYAGTIRNVGLKDISIRAGNRVGGIAAIVDGSSLIESCFVTGEIEGHEDLGGIAGAVIGGEALVRNCYSMADISILISMFPNPICGGIVGLLQNGEVRNCYATGVIIPHISNRAAAVVGSRTDGEINNVYWNVETTGVEYGVGREDQFPGNTSLEMLSRNTFDNFDFDEHWDIVNELTYPFLQWQEGPFTANIFGPEELSGTGGDTIVLLNWQSPIMDQDPLGYNVYQNHEQINEDLVEENHYQVTALENWEYNDYYVTAVYEVGESSPSNIISVSAVNFAGGNGSEQDPYLVETPVHLEGVSYALSAHYRQIDNIDLGVPPWNDEEGWQPIGTHNPGTRFTGVYDGNGYLINNMYINREENYQGLFAYSEGALLKNIAVENVDMTGNMYMGALVGFQNNTRIVNCSSSGEINSLVNVSSYTGGLVGHSRHGDDESNAIIDSYSSVNIDGATFSGGIVGYIWDGDIIRCRASGNINGRSSTGGLVGFARNNNIRESYATGNVTGSVNYTGGLVGTAFDSVEIRNCYARGNVLAFIESGGLVGDNRGTIRNCYSTGLVSGEEDLGGLIGINRGEVENSYWDIETSNQEDSAGGFGLFTRQMTYPPDVEIYENWNFDDIWMHDERGVLNDGYPMLHYQYHFIDTPQVSIELRTIDDVEHIIVSWQPVEDAASYLVFAALNPNDNDWGEPVVITAQTEYSEPVTDDVRKFFRVVASTEEAP